MYVFYVLGSLFTWIEIFLGFMIFFPVQLVVFLLTFWFDKKRRIIFYIGSAFSQFALFLSPIFRIKITGRENLDRSKPHVLVMNHQSLLDILLSFTLYYPSKMIAKKALGRVPFLGWELVLFGHLMVDRNDRKSQFESIRKMENMLENGDSLLVYPEGTRTRDGNIREFRKGAFRSATSTGTPVLPVVLDGPYDALPKKGIIVNGVFTLHMHVMEPVEVEKGADPAELAAVCHGVMSDELAKQRAQRADK
ncbi:MAG: lysophospholipid acyltransferase family protein [Spirochaetales bacterium]|uniref:1-acyl-sn-glycerol-3-phosphate acyltransferase n=1 Tax=Candidatus Thalassospirochaeta sargassi TaxID=3119039 RepID=A0AAJ1ICC8_9SPIO|nr:lysophospholipid acyltransferase family protein [Spirochaetales bacterium]